MKQVISVVQQSMISIKICLTAQFLSLQGKPNFSKIEQNKVCLLRWSDVTLIYFS